MDMPSLGIFCEHQYYVMTVHIACCHLSNTVRTMVLHDDGSNIYMHNNDYVRNAAGLVIHQVPKPVLLGDQTASHFQTIRRN